MKIENRYIINDTDARNMALAQNITEEEASIILKNMMIEQFKSSFADVANSNIDIWSEGAVTFYQQICFIFSLDEMINITQCLDEIKMTEEQKQKISNLLCY